MGRHYIEYKFNLIITFTYSIYIFHEFLSYFSCKYWCKYWSQSVLAEKLFIVC